MQTGEKILCGETAGRDMTKRNKKRTKKDQGRARVMRSAKGVKWSWKDTDPLGESNDTVSDVVISHRNYCLVSIARSMVIEYKDWLTEQQSFDWLLEIAIVSRYPDGLIQREIREISVKNIVFSHINGCALEEIEDAMRYSGGEYLTTEFKAECLGVNSNFVLDECG